MVGNRINKSLIIKLYRSGNSTRNIAARFNTTHTHILQILDDAHIPRRTKKESLQKYVRFNTCVVCGNQFRARESYDSTTNPDRVTCGDTCHSALASHTHRKRYGHSPSFYQRRRQEFYPDGMCHDCGTTKDIETHHIDRNKRNNRKDNLMPLCSQCHAKRHFREDKVHVNGKFEKNGFPYL